MACEPVIYLTSNKLWHAECMAHSWKSPVRWKYSPEGKQNAHVDARIHELEMSRKSVFRG